MVKLIKNKIIPCILAIQILFATLIPVVVNAVTVEFPIKTTIEKKEDSNDGIQVISGDTKTEITSQESGKTINEVDWKNINDEELADAINVTPEEELVKFLINLSEEEKVEILSKETALTQERIIGTQTGNTFIDETGATWPEMEFKTTHNRYYDYLIENHMLYQYNNSQIIEKVSWNSSYTSSDKYRGNGSFSLKITQDGEVKTNLTFSVYNVKSVNDDLFKDQEITTGKPNAYCQITGIAGTWVTNSLYLEIHPTGNTWGGIVVNGRFTKPEHYYTTWELGSSNDWKEMTKSGGTGRLSTHNNEFTTDTLNHGHGAITNYVRIQCNSMNCGLMSGYENVHRTGIIEMKKFNEELKIDPNGGEHGGNTQIYTLSTKQCTETTTVEEPTRRGYKFLGWTIDHETGANGTLEGDTYTHCINDAGWDGDMDRPNDDGYWGVYTKPTRTTTLKANWVFNSVSGTISWEDEDNKYLTRPENANIYLYRDGIQIQNATGLDSYIFENLQMFDEEIYTPEDYVPYEYTITQDNIPGYETIYDGYDIVNKLILPTYLSNITYTPIGTYQNKYLKNGKVKVTGEIQASEENRDYVGLHQGRAIFTIDDAIAIDPSTVEVNFYEASTDTTTKLTNYQISGNTITATFGKNSDGINGKGDKIIITANGIANKLGEYVSTIEATGNLRDYKGINTNVNLGQVTVGTQNVTIEHQIPKAKIQITKKDSITEQNLQDATFTLYEWDGTKYIEKETIQDLDSDGIYTSQEYEWNAITQGKYKIKETGIPQYHKNLDFSMEFTINELRDSSYTITPEYNNGAYKIAYALRNPDDFDMIIGVVENEPIKVKAKIEKVDSITNKQIKENAVFSIYEWDNTINEYKEYISYTNRSKPEMQRQEDGTYLTSEWLYYTPSNEGKYRIIETIAPKGYYGDYINQLESNDKNAYDINIIDVVSNGEYKGQTATNESTLIISNQGQTGQEEYLTNKRVKAEAILQVIDSGTKTNIAQADATLQGATYSIYALENIYHADGVTTNYETEEALLYKAGELIKTLKTDENGKIVFEDLECGKYYIKQDKPSTGYIANNTIYRVDLTYQGENIEKVVATTTTELVVKKEQFQMRKLQNDGETDYKPLAGAGFSIYLISNLSIVKEGKITKNENGTYTLNDTDAMKNTNLTKKANEDGTYDIKDLVDYYYKIRYEEGNEQVFPNDGQTYTPYNLQGETLAKIYDNIPTGEEILEQKTDEEGYLLSPKLAYGQYIVMETSVPTNYEVAIPFIVDVTQNSDTPQNLRFVVDKEYKARVKVNKIDETTGKLILNNTAKYVIRNKETGELVTYTDSENGNIEYGTQANPYTINSRGYLITPVELSTGNYELIEVEAPNGYVLNGYEGHSENYEIINTPKSVTQINITSNTAHYMDELLDSLVITVRQENSPQVGSLKVSTIGEKLTKVEQNEEGEYEFKYEQKEVQGASYEIKAAATIYTQDGYNTILYNKDDSVMAITSDESGFAFADNLPIGEYTIQQTKSGEGYTINKDKKYFKIEYGNNNPEITITSSNWKEESQKTSVTKKELNYANQRQKIDIEITKKDEQTGKTLQGAEFGLYNKTPIKNQINNEDLIPQDTKIQTVTSNEEGIVNFQNELPLGEYYVKEENAPEGYIHNTQIIQIDATYNQDQRQTIQIKQDYTNKQTDLNIYKTDENDEMLEGSVLQIVQKDTQEVIDEWSTIKNLHNIRGLKTNKNYILKEISPTPGYATAEEIEFLIERSGKLQINNEQQSENVIFMKDPIIKVEINLKNDENQYVQGAKLQLINKQTGEVIQEWETTNGSHTIEKIPIGEYIIKQIQTPTDKGYATIDNQEITIIDTKETQKVDLIQPVTKVEITLKNKEESFVQGARLQLINKETLNIIDQWETTDESHIIEKLPVADYIVKQVQTPTDEGYATMEDRDIKVIDTREVQKFEVLQPETKLETNLKDKQGNYVKKAKLQLINKQTNQVIDECETTDESHIVEKVPIGDYKIKQVQTPTDEGYATMEDKDIQVIDTKEVQKQDLLQPETKLQITLKNKDGEYVEGAKLQLINQETKEVVYEWITTDKPYIIEKIPVRDYQIIEAETPTDRGYVTIDPEDIQIINTNETQIKDLLQPETKLEISIKNKEGEYLEKVKVQLIDKQTGEVVYEWITTNEPHIIEKIPVKDYIIKEVEVPTQEGYVTIDPQEIKIIDTKELQKEEIIQPETRLEISLKNKEDEYVEGAKVQLVDKQTGEIIDEWETTKEPHIIEKIPVGDYEIKQIETPIDEGYTTFDPQDIKVKDTKEPQKEEIIQPEITLEVHIKDEDGEYVEETKVQLIDKQTGEIIEEWITDDKPHIIEKLPPKDYIVHIVEVPEDKGYVIVPDKEITLENKKDMQKVEVIQDVTKVSISIVDIENEQPVIGATLQLLDKDKNILKEWISDGKEQIIKKLPIGEYKIVQTEAPTLRGYVKSTPVRIGIINTKEVQKLLVEEDFTKIEIQLVDKISKEVVQGVQLVLKNEKGKELATWTTKEEMYHIERLPVGKYTIESKNEVYGYKTIKQEIEIKESNTVQTYLLEVEREEFDLEVTKWVDRVIRNGKTEQKNTKEQKGKIVKIDVKEKKAKTEDIRLVYKIRIANVGKVTGTVGKIIENIPSGFEYYQEDNKGYWHLEGKQVVSTDLVNKQIKPGQYADVEIVLRWKNGIENFGTKTNVVTLENATSDLKFTQSNEKNDKASAEVIMGVSTGEMAMVQLCWILMAILLIIEVLAAKQLRKKGYKKVIYRGK